MKRLFKFGFEIEREKEKYLFLSSKNFQNKNFKMFYLLASGYKCNFFSGNCFLANENYFSDCFLFKYVNACKCWDYLEDLVFIGQLE